MGTVSLLFREYRPVFWYFDIISSVIYIVDYLLRWATITLTTVGYGDLAPVSELGRTLSMISSLIGIGVIAMPSSIITAGFMQELNRRIKEEEECIYENKIKTE